MTGRGDVVGTIAGARVAGPGAELLPGPGPWDVMLRDGRIADIAPAGALRPRGEVLAADGAWLVPGLWDHHVHSAQAALAASRTDLSDAATAADAADVIARAEPDSDGTRVGVGFRDALWPDRPSRATLDAATGPRPAYLISADAHSVWLNSAALERERLDAVDGVLREELAFEVSRRLAARAHRDIDELLDRWLRAAAARGVVGIVDLEMAWNPERWRRRADRGADPVRVRCGVHPADLDRAIGDGLRSGAPVTPDGSATVGPVKVITDGSLGTRTAACSQPYPHGGRGELTVPPAELRAVLAAAAAAGLECAVHAIGDVAVSHALDAFAATGAQGTIEHVQLVAHADLARFGRSGIDASVQPAHALDDRELADREWALQTAMIYPLRALAAAGAGLRFGSDAPVADADPWAGIAAAVHRRRAGEPAWHPEQTVDAVTALAAAGAGGTRNPSTVSVGAPADLALIGADPAACDAERLARMPVLATLLAGRVTHVS